MVRNSAILITMDFLNPKKKRAQQIRLLIGYGLMGIALVISTLIVVFVTFGYDIDRKTGTIIQNGLIIVDSHPESSDIYMNNEQRGRTGARLVLPAGHYDVELKRDGYRTWTHSIDLEGSSIEQLVYPVLFPEKLVTEDVTMLTRSPAFASQSPDRRWLVVPMTDRFGSFQLFDLDDDQARNTAITLPTDTFTSSGSNHRLSPLEWSSDNTHLLLRHTWNDGQEFIMLNRNRPAASFSVSKLFPSQTIGQVALRDKRPDQFYLYDSGKRALTRASRGSRDIQPVASDVLAFKSYQADIVLYATASSIKNHVDVRLWENGQSFPLRTLPAAKSYLLDVAGFGNHLYVVAGSPADGRIYLYRDPLTDLKRRPAVPAQAFRVLVVDEAQYMSFSTNARFIAVQGRNAFAVYDAETNRQYRYKAELKLADNQKASWMDGHRLSIVSDGKIAVFDFDGTNLQVLSPALPNYAPIFDRTYERLYSFVPVEETSAALRRTELRVLPGR